jgi:hypothetical protein
MGWLKNASERSLIFAARQKCLVNRENTGTLIVRP